MISVIIPTHNRAELLVRAIKSVQNQTRKVDEIIVVSDGSTDNTAEVMQRLCAEDSRIRFIEYHPGINGNHARNVGIESVNGEYLAFIDDDDEWMPHKTEMQMKVFENNPEVGLVYSGQLMKYTDLEYSYCTKPVGKGDLSKRILVHNDIAGPVCSMIKKDVIVKAGLFDEELLAQQDYDLWIRVTPITLVDYVYEPCVTIYNSIGSGQITSNTEKYIKSKKRILEKYEDRIQQYDKEYQSQIYSAANLAIARRCMRNNEGKDARRYIGMAWKIKKSKSCIALYLASFCKFKMVLMVRSRFKY